MFKLERVSLFLHIAFAIFTLGPLTAATMATPRHIRRGDLAIVRYLNRATRVYGVATLGIVAFGLLMTGGRPGAAYLTASLTLFIVALGMLLVIERDQRRSVHALARAEAAPRATVPASRGGGPASGTGDASGGNDRPERSAPEEGAAPEGPPPESAAETGDRTETGSHAGAARGRHTAAKDDLTAPAEPARVERGRIATISGIVAVIWLVILALMIWGGPS
jgi:hypothetical protein